MTARESFLAAICATPDDDTVRLVYADWLEEHGNDPVRAAVIRACVPHPDVSVLVRRRALANRKEIWDFTSVWAGGKTGAPALPPGTTMRLRKELPHPNLLPHLEGFTYRRGFVESVRLSWGTWTQESVADGFRAQFPLTRIDLTTEPEFEAGEFDAEETSYLIAGEWITAPANFVPSDVTERLLYFAGLRWPVTFTSPRSRRK